MRRTVMSLITVGLLVPFAGLFAQEPPTIKPGERVRVSKCRDELLRSGRRRNVCKRSVGTLTNLSTNTITVADGAEGLVFALDSVSMLEVHQGRKSNYVAAGVTGAILGAAAGGIVGYTFSDLNEEPKNRELATVGGALACGTLFGVFGAVLGTIFTSARWEEVPLDRLRVSIAPQQDGFAFGVRVRF